MALPTNAGPNERALHQTTLVSPADVKMSQEDWGKASTNISNLSACVARMKKDLLASGDGFAAWSGPAADAAGQVLDKLVTNLDGHAENLHKVSVALDIAYQALGSASASWHSKVDATDVTGDAAAQGDAVKARDATAKPYLDRLNEEMAKATRLIPLEDKYAAGSVPAGGGGGGTGGGSVGGGLPGPRTTYRTPRGGTLPPQPGRPPVHPGVEPPIGDPPVHRPGWTDTDPGGPGTTDTTTTTNITDTTLTGDTVTTGTPTTDTVTIDGDVTGTTTTTTIPGTTIPTGGGTAGGVGVGGGGLGGTLSTGVGALGAAGALKSLGSGARGGAGVMGGSTVSGAAGAGRYGVPQLGQGGRGVGGMMAGGAGARGAGGARGARGAGAGMAGSGRGQKDRKGRRNVQDHLTHEDEETWFEDQAEASPPVWQ